MKLAFGQTMNDYKGHWAEKSIESWIDKGYIRGYEDGMFKPDNDITRAEVVDALNKSYLGFVKVRYNESGTYAPALIDGSVVTPKAAGTAIITVTSVVDGSKTAYCTVIVEEPVVEEPVVATVNLGMAGDYAILTKTGISSVPYSDITGKAYATDYAAGRAASYTELHTGDISGQTLTPGVYKWGTSQEHLLAVSRRCCNWSKCTF